MVITCLYFQSHISQTAINDSSGTLGPISRPKNPPTRDFASSLNPERIERLWLAAPERISSRARGLYRLLATRSGKGIHVRSAAQCAVLSVPSRPVRSKRKSKGLTHSTVHASFRTYFRYSI